jgi:hypothetical protein
MPSHMRPTLIALFLSIFLILFNASTSVAQDDEEEREETARVARVSLLRGDVSIQRGERQDWERAALNLPLVEADTLATGRGAHLEIQIDRYNFVRVNEDSVLRIVTLRDEGIALSLSEGTASVRLARFEREREYFEIDAPQTTLALEQTGLYRIDARSTGDVRIIVRDGGRARVYSETSGFTVRDGRMAELVYAGEEAGDWNITTAGGAFDEWDRWTEEREGYLAARLRRENRDLYYDRDIWGAEELDAYGDWAHTNEYGWVWRPHVTVINNYYNWSPYRYGRWRWVSPFGWTWVGDEPWGWAPYHYGRWVHHGGNWCWTPRFYGYVHGRNRWRPALVAFVTVINNNYNTIAWYPLPYHRRDSHGRYNRRRRDEDERLTPLRRDEIANLERTNPAYLRAVTTLPAREFGAETARARPANLELARRAITSEPLRGRLPVAIQNNPNENASGDGNNPRGVITRRTPTAPARSLPERPTGAVPRTPGVALDEELRRVRIFENRQPRPRPVDPASENSENNNPVRDRSGQINNGSTGAVMRRARPVVTRPRDDQNSGNNNNGDFNNRDETNAPPVVRPVRPTRPRDDRPAQPPTSYENPAGEERRRVEPRMPTVPRNERPELPAPRREEPPAAPPREERPAPSEERPAPREERPAERERPAPARPPRESEPRAQREVIDQ